MTAKIALLVTVCTAIAQTALYLLTGGYSIGSRQESIIADIKLLRHEVTAQNKIQDFRLDRLEARK
jgi:hypothetical protein